MAPPPSSSTPPPAAALERLESFDVTAFGAHLTLLVPHPSGPALLVSPTLGEWLALDITGREESTTVLEREGLRISLARSTGIATLTVGDGPTRPLPVVARPTTIARDDGFHPTFSRLVAPAAVTLGARSLVPEEVPSQRLAGCVVHGARPGASGALGEALRAGWESEASAVCAAHGDGTVLETSYSVVRFVGINRLDAAREPGPTDVAALTWSVRATSPTESTVTETGSLVGLATATVTPLRSLLAPTGLDWLEREARTTFSPPAGLDRRAVVDVARATLTVGVSTVDVVVPTAPFGIFLRSRHIALGPRSTVAPAFVRGPLTQRMLAMVNVDY